MLLALALYIHLSIGSERDIYGDKACQQSTEVL